MKNFLNGAAALRCCRKYISWLTDLFEIKRARGAVGHETWDLTNESICRYLLGLEKLWFACYSRFIETNLPLSQVTEKFRDVTTHTTLGPQTGS